MIGSPISRWPVRRVTSVKESRRLPSSGIPRFSTGQAASAGCGSRECESLGALSPVGGHGLPVETGTGGRTKWNRTRRSLPKPHWVDAACVGASTPEHLLLAGVVPLQIRAQGRHSRQMCRTTGIGFPIRRPKPPAWWVGSARGTWCGPCASHQYEDGHLRRAHRDPRQWLLRPQDGTWQSRGDPLPLLSAAPSRRWLFLSDSPKKRGASSPGLKPGSPRQYL